MINTHLYLEESKHTQKHGIHQLNNIAMH